MEQMFQAISAGFTSVLNLNIIIYYKNEEYAQFSLFDTPSSSNAQNSSCKCKYTIIPNDKWTPSNRSAVSNKQML